MKPNILVILVDGMRFDEFGAGGHPFVRTPNVDRIAHEGVMFTQAFHTTPLAAPSHASILSGQYSSRHGVLARINREAAAVHLPDYHVELQKLGYETAHIGAWPLGHCSKTPVGYDRWIGIEGVQRLDDPTFNEDGIASQAAGYSTDLLNEQAVRFIEAERERPFALLLAYQALGPHGRPPSNTAAGSLSVMQYPVPPRHRDLYTGELHPARSNVMPLEVVARTKPAWADATALQQTPGHFDAADSAAAQEAARARAAMMASIDEGVGGLLDSLLERGRIENTLVVFTSNSGAFLGEHGLGPERRFAYEEAIRAPLAMRYPRRIKPGTRIDDLVLNLDLAPTLLTMAGGRPGPDIQGRSLLPLFVGRRADWRRSFLCEFSCDTELPWIAGMSYRAVRTRRYKYIHWVNKPGTGMDELYDLENDPYEMKNIAPSRAYADIRARMRRELTKLVAEALGL